MSGCDLVIVRGGGDLATGIVQKFFRAGFRALILETARPTAIRRSVALCEAVYDGFKEVEDVQCRLIEDISGMDACFERGEVPLIVDPRGAAIEALKPSGVVDAIIAKRNTGTRRDMAKAVIALGPGFEAGVDCDVVIETVRSHDLGRLIFDGRALENTGIPGELGGRGAERVIHSPASGVVRHAKRIGDVVQQGETVFYAGDTAAFAPFSGLLRGLIREGLDIPKGLKAADIDPRTDVDWRTISDKARCLGGAALEAYLWARGQKGAAGACGQGG